MIGIVLYALVPVVLLIGLGHVLRWRTRLLPEEFWPPAERLSYYVLLPSLFFHGLATAELGSLPVASLAGTLVASTLVVAALVTAMRPLIKVDGSSFTSVFQGAVRFNNYIGVTLAVGIFGSDGLALAAICNACIVPTVNILCVLIFARFSHSPLDLSGVLRQLATNPLILSCLAGIAAQLIGLGVPGWIEPALRTLGAAALPMGLLCVGAALNFAAVRTGVGAMITASAFRFVVMPAAALIAGLAFGLTGPALIVAVMFQSLPTASSSYILARQLGGNASLMAGIIAFQTLLAGVMIPLVMAAFVALSGVVPPVAG